MLLATGTAVVKNTFSTLDACCWKKKSHIYGTRIRQSSKELKPPQRDGHPSGRERSVQRDLHWEMFCLCSGMRSPHCLTVQCGQCSQLCPPGCLPAASQLPNPVVPCAQRLLQGCCSPADDRLRGSPRAGFPSELSTLCHSPILLRGWEVLSPPGFRCMQNSPGEGPEHRAAAQGWALNSATPDSSPNCCLVVVKVRQGSQPLTLSFPIRDNGDDNQRTPARM